ncbi:P-type conjugative transfer protein TrbL [Acidithiobacillus sp.]|uniref:P-type conjugative transfer protein TrbL n=1 Tax=Acidithiobacillus sp. TaxID=1872118 RepID=UPI003CFE966C
MKNLKSRLQLLFVLLLMPVVAQATTSVGLSTIMSTFRSVTNGWYSAIFTDALGMFGALFGIEVTWLAVTWLIGGKDVHDIFSSLIKKLITIGFFYTVLEYSAQWVPWILNGFKNVAVTAGGEPITTVGFIAMTGIRAFVICVEAGPLSMAHDATSFWTDTWNLNLSGMASSVVSLSSATMGTVSGVDLILGAIIGLILLLSFTYVVLELVAVQLEGMIVLSVGVIMLGFGGAQWTMQFVEAYMKYAVAVGVRLMVITLWASFIEWQVNPLIKTTLINGNASLESYAVVLILALLVAFLTKKLPSFASSILSGQSTLSGGEMYDAVKKGSIAAAAVITGGAVLAAGKAGAATAGAMSAAEGAAGGGAGAGATAGSMGASAGASGAGSAEAGAMEGSKAIPAPKPEPTAPSGGSGVQAPTAPASTSAGSSGGQSTGSSGGQAPASTSAGSGGGQAPASTSAGSSGGQAPASEKASSGTQTEASPAQTGAEDAPPVDHRPSTPNATPSGGGSGGGGVPAPAPTTMDVAKQRGQQAHRLLKGYHPANERADDKDARSIGKHDTSGVAAPGLGVKHLSD